MKNFISIIGIALFLLNSIPFFGQSCSYHSIYSLPIIACNSSVIVNGLSFELTKNAAGNCYIDDSDFTDVLSGRLEINLASLANVEEVTIVTYPDGGVGYHYLYSGSTLVDSGLTDAGEIGIFLTNPMGLTIDKLILVSSSLYLSDISIKYNCDPGPCEPKIQIEAEEGDVYIDNSCYGAILTSPNGSCYRIRVNDNGSLITEEVTCP